MKELVLAFGTGVMVGVVFALFKLPIPAPPTLAGVLGIVGIYIGYLIVKMIR